jgi:hypothetical protein
MIVLKECGMFFIDTGGPECPCIMHTPRVTKRIINDEKIMRHNDCLGKIKLKSSNYQKLT